MSTIPNGWTVDSRSREVFGVTYRTLVNRARRHLERATPADLEAAARWYDDAHSLAVTLSQRAEIPLEHAAAVISAHSPRTLWSVNVAAATAHLTVGPTAARRLGVIGANVARATRCKASGYDGLGNGPKTHAFARNIAGERDVVTVDVWMCRALGIDQDALGRVGAYEIAARAIAAVSREAGLEPATGQAAIWIVAKKGKRS